MKRFVSLMLVVLLVATLFVGCSSGASSSPEGTYKIKSIDGKDLKTYFTDSLKEQGIAEEDFDSMLGLMGLSMDTLSDFMTITLNKDGTVTMDAMDEDATTGTWKLEGDQLTISADGEDMVFTYSGNEIVAEIEGQKMILSK